MSMKIATLTLAGAAFAIGATATATPETPKSESRTEQIVVIRDGGKGGTHGEHAARRVRVEALDRTGSHCSGRKSEVDEASRDGRERTHILVCGDRLSAADRASELEHALARIEANSELSAEHKARVVAALREAIDRARSGQ
jgi:hypothetical protein